MKSPSTVLLFGREMDDVAFNAARAGKGKEVLQGSKDKDRRLARIYAFAYEGHYYDLASPAIFVVHGPGVKPPNRVDQLGVASSSRKLADDVMVWEHDKSDLSVRLNIETGSLQDILLDAELSADRLKLQFAGQKVRLRGDSSGYE